MIKYGKDWGQGGAAISSRNARTVLLFLWTCFISISFSQVNVIRLPDYQVQEEAITCFGPLPPFKLPRSVDSVIRSLPVKTEWFRFRRRSPYRDSIYDANNFTLQELCAKGQRPAGQNAGGICDSSTDQVWFNGPRYKLRDTHRNSDSRGDVFYRAKHSPLETVFDQDLPQWMWRIC